MSTRAGIAGELEYYLGYAPTADIVGDAEEWQEDHPGESLSVWVDAMIEIGAL